MHVFAINRDGGLIPTSEAKVAAYIIARFVTVKCIELVARVQITMPVCLVMCTAIQCAKK